MKFKTTIISVVVGALCLIKKDAKNHFIKISGHIRISELQTINVCENSQNPLNIDETFQIGIDNSPTVTFWLIDLGGDLAFRQLKLISGIMVTHTIILIKNEEDDKNEENVCSS